MPEIHDATFKILFDNELAVAHPIAGFVRRLLGPDFDYARLDLDSLEPAPTECVSDDLRQSRSDRLRRLRWRAADGAPEWAYLVIMLEFRSGVDPDMASRVHAYTGQLYLRHRRGADGRRRRGPLPPVLPIVIYNGLAAAVRGAEHRGRDSARGSGAGALPAPAGLPVA